MCRLIFSCFLIVSSSFPTFASQAQSVTYRLRTPSLAEYSATIAQIAKQFQQESSTDGTQQFDSDNLIRDTVGYELRSRYSDLSSVSFDTLYNAAYAVPRTPYEKYAADWKQTPPYSFTERAWHSFLIDAWLRENQVDLSLRSEWHIKNYTLKVTPVDFNGDGIKELIVEVTYTALDQHDYRGFDFDYHDFWVLARDRTQPTGYRRIKTPVPYFSAGCGFYVTCGGDGQTIRIGDVNGDGLPEWSFAVGRLCGSGQCEGYLLVMGWRHGELVNLVSTGSTYPLSWSVTAGGGGGTILPAEGTWTFRDSVPKRSQDLVQRLIFKDNRDCLITRTTILQWHPQTDKYAANDPSDEYAKTWQCAMRRGHTAMIAKDYQGAVEAYRAALEQVPVNGDDYTREARQYIGVRLALAYALNQQSADALAMTAQFMDQIPETPTMGSLLNALAVYHNDTDRITLCGAIYSAVKAYNLRDDDKSNLWLFGRTEDGQERPVWFRDDNPDPSEAGCDIATIRATAFSNSTFSLGRSLDDELKAAGLHINTEFKIPLYGGRQTAWLIWTDSVVQKALLFAPSGGQYKFSQVDVAAPNVHAEFSTLLLPDDAGVAVIRRAFGEDKIWADDNFYPCGKAQTFGSLDIWRLSQASLQSIGRYLLCQPLTIAQLFPKSDELHAWTTATPDYEASETVFKWNDTEKSYVDSTLPLPTDQPTQDIYGCSGPYYFCGFSVPDIEALALIQKAFVNPPKEDADPFLIALRYRRALISENLGKTKAALADYVAVYTSGPNTAFGQLAKLHLDPLMQP